MKYLMEGEDVDTGPFPDTPVRKLLDPDWLRAVDLFSVMAAFRNRNF